MTFHFHLGKKASAEKSSSGLESNQKETGESSTGEKAKGHKNFHIELNCPPGHIFADNETVSGNCVLLSTHDEDIGSINVIFQGVVRSLVSVYTGNNNNQQPATAKYNDERILFTQEKILFEGKLKLPKNARYTWPFEFQFPQLTLPSAHLNADRGDGHVKYTLKASRGRSWQTSEQASRRLNAESHLAHAPFQPNKLFEKVGSFTGMVATLELQAVPARRGQPDMSLQQCVSYHNFNSGLSSLVRRHGSDDAANGLTIAIDLPRSLVRGLVMPVIIKVYSEMANAPAVAMRSISIQLVTIVTVRASSSRHQSTSRHKSPLLEMSRQSIPLAFGTPIDLGVMAGSPISAQGLPSFESDLLSLTYGITVDIVVECGGKSFEGKHTIENVQIW